MNKIDIEVPKLGPLEMDYALKERIPGGATINLTIRRLNPMVMQMLTAFGGISKGETKPINIPDNILIAVRDLCNEALGEGA